MTIRRTSLTLLALGALSASAFAAVTPGSQPVETTHTETLDFAPGGTVRVVNPRGYLSIEAWDQAKIAISVVKSMGYDPGSAQKAAAGLDNLKIVTERRSPSEVAISTTRIHNHNRFVRALRIGNEATAGYVIQVPRDSHVIVSHADGYVSIVGVTGTIEADDRRGDIVVMLPGLANYSISAHSRLGTVTSDLAGASHMKHLTGESFTAGASSLPHQLKLKMGFGGIAIKELPPEAVPPVMAFRREPASR